MQSKVVATNSPSTVRHTCAAGFPSVYIGAPCAYLELAVVPTWATSCAGRCTSPPRDRKPHVLTAHKGQPKLCLRTESVRAPEAWPMATHSHNTSKAESQQAQQEGHHLQLTLPQPLEHHVLSPTRHKTESPLSFCTTLESPRSL